MHIQDIRLLQAARANDLEAMKDALANATKKIKNLIKYLNK